MDKVVALILAVFTAMWAAGLFHPERLVDRETRLGVFEHKITGVTSEFMRRSDQLAETFKDFDACMKKGSGCDPKGLLLRRDIIIELEWKDVFDRLLVLNDWSTEGYSRGERDAFFREAEKTTRSKLRDLCVPLIEYRRPIMGGETISVYRFMGFKCRETAGARHLSRASFFL